MSLSAGGCSSTALIDNLPASVGLPAGTPERAAVPLEYPAVNDMPPPRDTKMLTADEQKKLQADLVSLRESQEHRAGKPAPQGAGKPAESRSAEKTNPADQPAE